MQTLTDVANLALARIGSDPIEAIDDTTKEGRLISHLLTSAVDAELRLGTWRFAERTERLAALEGAPFGDYENVFALPADCLRVKEVDETSNWTVAGGRLYTDSSTATVRYTARVMEPSLWDPLFSDVVSFRLAAELAFAVAASQTLAQQMWQARDALVGKARATSSMERTKQTTVDSWIAARM